MGRAQAARWLTFARAQLPAALGHANALAREFALGLNAAPGPSAAAGWALMHEVRSVWMSRKLTLAWKHRMLVHPHMLAHGICLGLVVSAASQPCAAVGSGSAAWIFEAVQSLQHVSVSKGREDCKAPWVVSGPCDHFYCCSDGRWLSSANSDTTSEHSPSPHWIVVQVLPSSELGPMLSMGDAQLAALGELQDAEQVAEARWVPSAQSGSGVF